MSQTETELMTPEEHTEVYKTMAETIVNDEESLDERVLRGALHLDEHFPGWAHKIDLKKFRIESAENCVIGQLHGDYWDYTINKVAKIYPEGDPSRWNGFDYDDAKLGKFAKDHGFYSDEKSEDGTYMGDYRKLQESWVRAIKARQGG